MNNEENLPGEVEKLASLQEEITRLYECHLSENLAHFAQITCTYRLEERSQPIGLSHNVARLSRKSLRKRRDFMKA